MLVNLSLACRFVSLRGALAKLSFFVQGLCWWNSSQHSPGLIDSRPQELGVYHIFPRSRFTVQGRAYCSKLPAASPVPRPTLTFLISEAEFPDHLSELEEPSFLSTLGIIPNVGRISDATLVPQHRSSKLPSREQTCSSRIWPMSPRGVQDGVLHIHS